MKETTITYKEIESKKEGSKYHFYKGNKHIATVYKDKINIYDKTITKEEIEYIKKVASL